MIVALAALALLTQTPADAPPPEPQASQTEQPAAAPPPKEKVICRVQRTGVSRIPSRVCATASQWESRRRADQADMEKFSRDNEVAAKRCGGLVAC
ncbi:MAG: hypothetical protein IT546_16715 [Caulobacteraceae bacterium]|nr:hypothetical protein [Caulobacteraceae bacterium]